MNAPHLSSFLRARASRAISVRSAELALRDGILMPQMKKGIMGGFANPPQETAIEVHNLQK